MKGNKKLILGIIVTGAFISSLNQTVMIACLPKIIAEFQINAGLGQWLTTVYLLFLGVMIPCTGYLMERFSAKKLYIASIFLFLVGCIIAVMANGFSMLLFARIVQACGAGILLPLPQVVAFRLYESNMRGTIMGIVGLTTGFAPAFGPTIAGWLTDMFGWKAIFYTLGVLTIASIIMAFMKMTDEKVQTKNKLDIISVVLSTIGFGGLLTGVTNQGNHGIQSWITLAPLFMGIVCILLFVYRQLHMEKPLLQLRILKSGNFTLGCVLLLFTYGVMLTVTTLISIYIQTCRGFSATLSGLIVLPGSLLLAILSPLTGKILDRKGPFLLGLFGSLFLGLGSLLMVFVGNVTPLAVAGISNAVVMLGVVSLMQPLMTWSVDCIPDAFTSQATAIMNTARQIGGAIVSSFFVEIMTVVGRDGGDLKGIHISLLVSAIVMFACAIVVVILMRPKTRLPQPIKSVK